MELKTIGLTKKFGSKTAVDNLNITLTNGVYGLLGANGAGKTTLMRLLCNIQNPTSGKILLNGKNIVGLGERYRNLLGYLLTSKYGKTKCATAKVVAGIITAILTTTLIAAFNLLLAFVFYGTEGLDCSILFAPSDYVEAFIPFNITCGTLLKYQILLAFTCTLSVTGITLFLSAISKNQIVALVAAMAIFLFPVLLPITEVNPLFRLVGLLPIYHVLAISLLSVEQMSNGMLYAIWAIPAALLFLGVGAGISRRVFAKHQVL